jgi:hypothetical protein
MAGNPVKTPAAFRRFAEGVPEDIRAQIPQAELDCRAKHCAELAIAADSAPPEHSRYLTGQIKRIQSAMAYQEYCERRAILDRHSRKPHINPDVRSAHSAALRELEDANQYPPCLDACLDAARSAGANSGTMAKSREEMLQIHRDALHLAADIAAALSR